MKKLILSVAAALLIGPAMADEGMWLLPLLKQQKIEDMRQLGLQLTADEIYNPDGPSLKDAVVRFGGGCTGEVVSADGLVLTNHHCGYGYIQRHSSLEHDYLTDGFWAMSLEEELPNPGLTVTFIDKIEDVTDYVNEALAKEKDPSLFSSNQFLNELAGISVFSIFTLTKSLHPLNTEVPAKLTTAGTSVPSAPFFTTFTSCSQP